MLYTGPKKGEKKKQDQLDSIQRVLYEDEEEEICRTRRSQEEGELDEDKYALDWSTRALPSVPIPPRGCHYESDIYVVGLRLVLRVLPGTGADAATLSGDTAKEVR